MAARQAPLKRELRMEVVAVVAMRNAFRNTFKHRLPQHHPRRQTHVGMHDIISLRAKQSGETAKGMSPSWT